MIKSNKKVTAALLLAAAAFAALAIAGGNQWLDAYVEKSWQTKTASHYDDHRGGYQASAARRIREVFH